VSTETAARPADPLDRLRELHFGGTLSADYPRTAALLADLDDADLARAGRLLSRLDAQELAAAHPNLPVVRIAVTGHGTLQPLIPALSANAARHGLIAHTRLSDFDAYVFDLADPAGGLAAFEADLVLCVLDSAVIADELPVPWTAADAERVLAEKTDLIAKLAQEFSARSGATLVLNTIPLERRLTGQLVDYASRTALGVAWREANIRLLRIAQDLPNVVVVDLDPLIAEGVQVADPRLSLYTKTHLSAELLAAFAREIGHLARARAGRVKKVLALDLDNTLWGGVLGDDGPEGIEVAGGHRGEAFQHFQRVVKQIGSQGVLLVAASKNEAGPVARVLAEHPEMTVREADFVRVAANWEPKDANLRETAEALNLGVDSFVFVDDSPYECGLVRASLPDVAVVQVGEDAALHAVRVLRDGWFDTRSLTAEDRVRPAQYRTEAARADFAKGFSSLDDYLGELDVRVRLEAAAEADLNRVSQMTLRTNQFNLTTRRLQLPDVRTLLDDERNRVLTIRSADRFGDNGVVGAIFLRRENGALSIENFLLSCRVFSRGIEQACLAAVLRDARAHGDEAVLGAFRPTAKNGVVREFYPRHGFTAAAADPEAPDGTVVYRHDLREPVTVPEHVALTDDLERPAP
jgi:FkbH-like protein